MQEGPRNRGFGNRAPRSSVLSPFPGAASASALNYKVICTRIQPPILFYTTRKYKITKTTHFSCHVSFVTRKKIDFLNLYFLSCASFVYHKFIFLSSFVSNRPYNFFCIKRSQQVIGGGGGRRLRKHTRRVAAAAPISVEPPPAVTVRSVSHFYRPHVFQSNTTLCRFLRQCGPVINSSSRRLSDVEIEALALGRTYVPWSMRPQQQQLTANNTATTPQTAVADSFNFLRPSSSGAPSTSSSFVSSCTSDPPTPTATAIATATTTATGKGKGKKIAKVVVPSSSSSSSSSKSSSVDDWIRRVDTAAFFNDPRRDNPWTLPSGSTSSSSS